MTSKISKHIASILLILAVFAVVGEISVETAEATSEFYKGNVGALITKSENVIRMVRFIAVFIVIGGLIWAGVEFAIKNDQQKGSMVLISAVIGAFFVLIAPTIMNFVIGGITTDNVGDADLMSAGGTAGQ